MKTQTVCVLNLGVVLALVTVVAVTNSSGGAANAAAPTIATPNAENVELVGHIGGATVAVFVQGNYAYVGMGPELAVLDISDPTHPVRVGYVVLSDMELSTVHDIYVAGNYAYVAADSAGLRVVDVSRSTAPVEVGYYDIQGYATDVAVAGNYAYVIDFMRHVLHIVDITNPVAPVNVGVYDPPGWIVPYDVVVVGDYAYVANGGLQVVDVSDPTAPVLVSSLDTCGRARSVAVAGGYAYVTSDLNYTVADIWYAELNVVDISDPTLPVRVGICDTLKAAYDVAVIGDYAYVAGGEEGGLRVVDVSNPAVPTDVGGYDKLELETYSVAVGNGYVFIVDGGGGLRVVDFTNPTTPIETGVYDAPGLAWGVTVERTCIYVAGGEGGLQIVDVSKPAVLAGIGAYNTPGFTYDVAAVDAYAYVADGCRGLRIVDISNPAGPIEVGFYDTAGLAKSVAVVGSYAYVADDEGGLRVVSVSNPAAPYEIGFCDTPGNARRVVVVDSCAYVADGQEGLRVIDISDPTTPYEISAYNTLGSAYDVAVVDTYAYVANGQGLQVVDVSDPTAPHEVSFYETPIYVEGVAVAGDPSSGSGQVYALVADGYGGGLRVIDVSNPAAPVEVGFYNMSGAAVGVAAVGNYAYVAGKGAGLFILRYGASITGRVADVNSAPFSGVTISASSGLNTTTDATGTYTFTNHLLGTWVLTPTLTSYSFWPATRTVTLPPDASGQNFTILPGPVSTTLTPGTASSLVYTDTQGLPTRLDSPAGVVSQTTTLVLTPTLAPSVPGFAFAGHAFELSGFRVGKPLTNLIFDTPMTVTIHYSNNDVRVVSDESQLALWWWTGAGWEDAANTCDPPATSTFGLTDRDPVNRVLSVPICRPGPFGLFGPTRQVYLPVILRNS